MGYQNNRVERRRFPRVKRQIPLKIRLDDYDLVGRTHDISSIGAYCTINKYIPPFSLISIVLLVPLRLHQTHRGSNRICNIRCQGVVVRTEENPQNNKEYNIAIYFNRLRQSDKTKLQEYVQQHL